MTKNLLSLLVFASAASANAGTYIHCSARSNSFNSTRVPSLVVTANGSTKAEALAKLDLECRSTTVFHACYQGYSCSTLQEPSFFEQFSN